MTFCGYRTLLVGILVFCTLAGCNSEQAVSVDTAPAAVATYVGDESCADCHEDIYTSYHRTGMGRSVSLFDAQTAPEKFTEEIEIYNQRFDYYYSAFVQNDTLFQREYRKDRAGNIIHERVHPVKWVIGSGNATRSYLMNVNGHVTQMPLTWYVDKAQWDLSPAYAQQNFRFKRPISQECMTCHNGLPEYSPFTENHYDDVPLGITCERCHGPGGDHVDLRLAGLGPEPGEQDESIVNPAHLDRERQLSVCQQCHLTGTTVYDPGEDVASYHPGNVLEEHRKVFVIEERLADPEQFGISSHAQRLARSECFQQSEMTCVTCHDPHQPVAELDDNSFNEACISCHTPAEQDGPIVCNREAFDDLSEAMTGNCVGCHLQKSGTSDIPHVTFTDHWIRRTLPPAKPPKPIDDYNIQRTPFNLVRVESERTVNDAQADLEDAIAQFSFYDTEHRHPDYLPKIVRTARVALRAGADHPNGRLVLARALIDLDSLRSARTVLAEAVAVYPEHARLHFWQGEVYARLQQYTEAVNAFERTVALAPQFVQARIKLASNLSNMQQLAEAESILQQVVADNPVHFPDAWNNLGFIYLQTQRLDEASEMFDRAVALDPDLAIAWTNAGSVHLMQQDFDLAQVKLERAVSADPSSVPALGNLTLVYRQQGKIEQAKATLQQLLTYSPNDPNALALLRELNAL